MPTTTLSVSAKRFTKLTDMRRQAITLALAYACSYTQDGRLHDDYVWTVIPTSFGKYSCTVFYPPCTKFAFKFEPIGEYSSANVRVYTLYVHLYTCICTLMSIVGGVMWEDVSSETLLISEHSDIDIRGKVLYIVHVHTCIHM